jgi:predicted AAA+ superfamily ATPase
MYYCYLIRPWFRNVPKSLRKQPKVYLWDWSTVTDQGARYENFIASHLLKAVHFWTDAGFADYGLHFLRDKTKREVDFLITRNQSPWILVEVKSSGSKSISPNLKYFQKLLNSEHAFQIIADAQFVEQDCFTIKRPVKVPAQTFLSQLV